MNVCYQCGNSKYNHVLGFCPRDYSKGVWSKTAHVYNGVMPGLTRNQVKPTVNRGQISNLSPLTESMRSTGDRFQICPLSQKACGQPGTDFKSVPSRRKRAVNRGQISNLSPLTESMRSTGDRFQICPLSQKACGQPGTDFKSVPSHRKRAVNRGQISNLSPLAESVRSTGDRFQICPLSQKACVQPGTDFKSVPSHRKHAFNRGQISNLSPLAESMHQPCPQATDPVTYACVWGIIRFLLIL